MDTILVAQYNIFGRKCRREDTDRLLLKSVSAFCNMELTAEKLSDCEIDNRNEVRMLQNQENALQIKRNEVGKPYLVIDKEEALNRETLPFISVAHTGSHWFGAVSWHPVGIDVEIIKSIDVAKLAKRFYTPAEKEHCDRVGRLGFFRIWCRKEALVKMKGTTLGKGLSGFETVTKGEPAEVLEIEGAPIYLQDYCPQEGLAGCIASERKSRLYHVEIT